MIALRNVSKSYGKINVLSGAMLQVKPKDCVCIVGGSGSGKTTIVRLLLKLEAPTSGSVEVDGVDLKLVPSPVLQLFRRRVGIIFQEPVLLEHATVRENLSLPLEFAGAPAALIERSVNDLLKRLELSPKANSLPIALSLGERTLAGIARAIITAPMVIIADEPFSNLDTDQTKKTVELLHALQKNGTSIIMTSRTVESAHALDARVLRLEKGSIGSEQAPPKAMPKEEQVHRILEESEKISAVESGDEKNSNGKKIKITSIGSGLS